MKFFGRVGFWEDEVETCPGVWKPDIIERPYVGDVLRDSRRLRTADSQNGTFTVNNKISILGDLYACQNWPSIRYVVWNGVKWVVSSVEVEYPRLTLELGEVYNENENGSTRETV